MIINLELNDVDAYRLLWLVQRESNSGKVWDDYWRSLACHIYTNIITDIDDDTMHAVMVQEKMFDTTLSIS